MINTNQIIILDQARQIQPQEVFLPENMDSLLKEIESHAKAVVLDVTTEKGRKEIASWAFKIAKTKTALDNAGKALTDDWTRQTKAVNSVRKQAWDFLESLQKEIRAPLDQFEAIDAKRIKERQDRLASIESWRHFSGTIGDLNHARNDLKNAADFDWQEFDFKARSLAGEIDVILIKKLQEAEAREIERSELERLRAEAAERAQKDHEAAIAKEAAEKAKREAEEIAQKVAREAAEREEKIAEEKRLAEEAEIAAVNRANAAVALAQEVAEIAEKNRIAALEKAKRDAEIAAIKAVEQERQKVEAQKLEEQKAAGLREANEKHRGEINHDIFEHIINLLRIHDSTHDDYGFKTAESIIQAIAKGEVPHVSIKY